MLYLDKVFVTPMTKPGKMLAFANIRFSLVDGGPGALTIYGWKIFQSKDGNGIDVAPPSTFNAKKKEWYKTVAFDYENPEAKELINSIRTATQKVYDYIIENGTSKQRKESSSKDDVPF